MSVKVKFDFNFKDFVSGLQFKVHQSTGADLCVTEKMYRSFQGCHISGKHQK